MSRFKGKGARAIFAGLLTVFRELLADVSLQADARARIDDTLTEIDAVLDSDGDGVPDRYDAAPFDAAVVRRIVTEELASAIAVAHSDENAARAYAAENVRAIVAEELASFTAATVASHAAGADQGANVKPFNAIGGTVDPVNNVTAAPVAQPEGN